MADSGVAREKWSSRAGFIAATVGSAVGLGNIWRFPYMAGENGGGAFLVAYLICVLAVGAPLMMFELAAGRRYAGGVYGTIRAMAPRAKLLGAGIAVVSFVILSYYLVVASWTLGYVGITATGSETTFDGFTDSWTPVVLSAVTVVIGGAIVLRGVSGGIERAGMLLMPILAVMVIGLAALRPQPAGTSRRATVPVPARHRRLPGSSGVGRRGLPGVLLVGRGHGRAHGVRLLHGAARRRA